MTTKNAALWGVNILGPDDIFAVPDLKTAVDVSVRFNDWWASRFSGDFRDHDPLLWATPCRWPHSHEIHADELKHPRHEYVEFLQPPMTQASGNTPTPWRLGHDSEGNLVIFSDDGKPATPWTICEMCMMPDDDGTPNAKLIVEAVNTFAALQADRNRLREACERISAVDLGEQKPTEAHWPARLMQSIARAALGEKADG